MTATVDSPPRAKLWEHQEEALRFADGKPGIGLAIPMGGGKSRCAVEIAEQTAAMRVLILCPKSVVGVWPSQINEHAVRPYWSVWAGDVLGVRGPLRNPSVAQRAEALVFRTLSATRLGQPLAAVVNFEAAPLGQMGALLLGTPWDLLVIDESHRIKSPGGKVSRYVARLAAKVRGNGGRVIAQTGTPMPHSPLDAWAQARALDGGERFGTSYHKFCQHYGAGEQIYVAGGQQRTVYKGIRDDRLDEFTRLFGELFYHLPQDELDRKLGLPDTVDVHRTVELEPATRRAYDRMERDLIADVGTGTVTAANAMVLTTRLAQLSGGFSKDVDGNIVHAADPPEKAKLLADVLQDLDEPVVVFCRFHADLDAVRAVAEGLGRSYGELSGRRRDGLTDDSKMAAVDIMACQLQSGGVGIDLTRARVAVYYSLDFRLAEYTQSRKRVHRPGQTRTTTYIHLLAAETIDWAVYGALRKRKDVINAVLNRLTGRSGS